MNKAQSILEAITIGLPKIKQVLASDWPLFAQRLQAQADRFRDISDPAALDQAANQFLGLFIVDERVIDIIRPLIAKPPGEKHPLQYREPSESGELSTVANIFYLLASHPDDVAEGVLLEDIAEEDNPADQETFSLDEGWDS